MRYNKYSLLSGLLKELYEEIVDNDKRAECKQNSRPDGNCVLLFQFTDSAYGEWNPHDCIPMNLDWGMAILIEKITKEAVGIADSLSSFWIRLIWLSGRCSMTGRWRRMRAKWIKDTIGEIWHEKSIYRRYR